MRREVALFAVLLLACSEGERDEASTIFGSGVMTMSADGADTTADGSADASADGNESDATTNPSTSASTNDESTTDATTDSPETTGDGDGDGDTSDTNAPVCGNGSIDPGEECDGNNLGGSSCVDHGFDGGVLACDPVVCVYDTSGCTDMPSNECDQYCNGCACPSDACIMCCAQAGKVDVCNGGMCGCF